MNFECDACREPVRFSGPDRTYEHTRPTTCTGIDGLVLGVVVPERCRADVIDLGAARDRSRPE